MHLITYVDRLARDFSELRSMLQHELADLFTGVHVLPFFDAIDGADAGFDPVDHGRVDPRLGDWKDVKALSEDVSIMADLIVNHISADSMQFNDVLENGETSKYWNLFLRKDDVYKTDSELQTVDRIYRPRPTSPFTSITLQNGNSHEFWTTFSAAQLDINVETPAGENYLKSILETFSNSGVKEVRLDAAGYAIKRAGSRCFMLPETYAFLKELDQSCKDLGMITLVEIHSHYKQQIEIAQRVSRVYDFALPPLVLHAIFEGDAEPLVSWLRISPRNCVTVLDTHDGIGILDVAKDGDEPGLLNDQQIDSLVEKIHLNSEGQSRLASGESASNLDVYQVNCTYFNALGCDEAHYLLARAIQFFVPGVPQVYYMGLLAHENDMALLQESGVGRDINRSHFTKQQVKDALNKPVVRNLCSLIKIRNSIQALEGDFSVELESKERFSLYWNSGDATASLKVDLVLKSADLMVEQEGSQTHYLIQKGGVVTAPGSLAS